jgi:hypothetical protein
MISAKLDRLHDKLGHVVNHPAPGTGEGVAARHGGVGVMNTVHKAAQLHLRAAHALDIAMAEARAALEAYNATTELLTAAYCAAGKPLGDRGMGGRLYLGELRHTPLTDYAERLREVHGSIAQRVRDNAQKWLIGAAS